ncbi:MAG TPA: alkaline phosphatase family protein, partial [Modicisalibacter sp.]|nr:alkaline phosphatase family protein [Modicisalibacter sp.]
MQNANASPAPKDESANALPDVLAGPLLRRIEPKRVVLWLVGSRPLALRLTLLPTDEAPRDIALDDDTCQCL